MTSASLAQDGESSLAREISSIPLDVLVISPAKEAVPTLEFTATPRTQPAFIRAAAAVGTGATMQPSASARPSYSTGSNSPGKAQLARMATSRGPLEKT